MSDLIHLVRINDRQYQLIKKVADNQRRSVTKELEGAIADHIEKHRSLISKEAKGTAKEYLKGAIK